MLKHLLSTVFIAFTVTTLAGKHKAVNTTFQFVPNFGQFDDRAKYKVDLPGGALFIENNKLTYNFYDAALREQLHHGTYQGNTDSLVMRWHAYQMTFDGANPSPEASGSEPYRHYLNYFIGNNPEKWASKVPVYRKVTYRALYDGIDFVLYNHRNEGLKYDLVVQPGADPSVIAMTYKGLDSLRLFRGRLFLVTSLGETMEDRPEAYQIVDGKRRKVACRYVLKGNTVQFEFPKGYDKTLPLVIDPVMIFSSYTGSTADNFGLTATYDKYGFLYSGSSAFGTGYPVTFGAYDVSFNGGTGTSLNPGVDIAITKWDTTGGFLIYSTYLGGSSDELPHSLIVSDYEELYVMGTTGSTDYPVTSQAFDTSFNVHPNGPVGVNLTSGYGVFYLNGSDIVVSKLDSTGSILEASTFLGGTDVDGLNQGILQFNYADEFRGEVMLDKDGKVYVASCTRSNDNPVTTVGFQTTKPGPSNDLDGIIFKLDHNLSTLFWTNYVGSATTDALYSIAIDSHNDIYVCGGTNSINFPVTSQAYDTTYNGARDAILAKISGDGTTLEYATYFGSSKYDQAYFVELDRFDHPHIYGQTSGLAGDLIYNANYYDSLGGQFIAKFTRELDTLIWSTRFGRGDGTPDISPTAFLVDVCSAVYISGWGSSILGGSLTTNGLDTANNPFQGTTDGQDFYLMVMSDDASSLLYATFIGGPLSSEHVDGGTSRFDKKGKVYQAVCAGCGGNSDFPIVPNPGAWSPNNNSTNCNLAVFKMDFQLPIVVADFDVPTTGCAPFSVQFVNLSLQQNATTFFWDFGDGSSSSLFQPSHTYSSPGVYTIMLVVSDTLTCNLNDTLFKTITVLGNNNMQIPAVASCPGIGVQIGLPNNPDPDITYTWIPTSWLSDSTISDPVADPPTSTTYQLIIDNGVCPDTITQFVGVDSITVGIAGDTFGCSADTPFVLTAGTNGQGISFFWSDDPFYNDTINADTTDSTLAVFPSDSVNYYYVTTYSANGCPANDTFSIYLYDLANPLNASFQDPGMGCAPYTVNFVNTTDSLTATTYMWSFGNGNTGTGTNPATVYNSKGIYTVTLIATDTVVCPMSDTFTLDIWVREDSNYTVNHLACLGQETVIGIPPDSFAGTIYTWIPPGGVSDPSIPNPTVVLTGDTTFLLVVQHVCTDSVTDVITVEPIYAQTDSFIVLCSDDMHYKLTGNSFGTGVGFTWSSQPDFSDTLNNSPGDSTVIVAVGQALSTYYFMVESQNGCIETDSVKVAVSDLGVLLSPDTFICHSDTITLTAVNLFPQNPMDYQWGPVDEIIGPADGNSIVVAPEQTTAYTIYAVNDSGCVFEDTILVEVSNLTGANVLATADHDSLLRGFATVLHAFPSGYDYQWEPAGSLADPTGKDTDAKPDTTTTFYLTVSDPKNGACFYKTDVTVIVYEINCGEPDIFVPNAFSPNDDGVNDVLFVRGKVIQDLTFKVYNRWGELVFETNDQQKGWDGRYKDRPVDPAVFVYHLDATCIDLRKFRKKGNITLIR